MVYFQSYVNRSVNALNEMTLVRLNPGLRILVETTSISHNRAVLEKRKLSGFDSL